MEKELLERLLEVREELEIPMEDYTDILAAAFLRRKESTAKISDELLYEIILTCLTDYDYVQEGIARNNKSTDELLERALLSLGLMNETINEEAKLEWLLDNIVDEERMGRSL